VAEFREARSKFLERKKEEDDKLSKTKSQANRRNEYTPVPGRIFRLNRNGGSISSFDRAKDKKKVFPAYFSQKNKTFTSNTDSDTSHYLDVSMTSTISGGILNGGKSPFRSFDAKRGSPDKTKLVQ
jgi:hypothetical protein